MAAALPAEFDPSVYRNLHADLRAVGFDDNGLSGHYLRHGRDEGRACSEIQTRANFLSLIPADVSALEICPGFTPALRHPGVRYYDTASRESLVLQATDLNVQTSTIPEIDFVSENDDLSIVTGKYDVVLSVHNIVRHPNMVAHLQQCEGLLSPGGVLFCIIPDKRYTYDHFTPETSLASLLARYRNNDNNTQLEHLLAAMGTSTHHNGRKHWAGRHGSPEYGLESRVNAILSKEVNLADRHINATYFTPASFRNLMNSLGKLQLTKLTIDRLYPPVYGNNEFYVVLKAID